MLHDLLSALRKLAKAPGFTLTAIVTLALGIGANTAIFGLIQSVLLTPPPFPRPEQLVAVRCMQPAMSWPVPVDYHEYLDWKEETDVFAELAVYNGFSRQILVEQGNVRSLYVHLASANYLKTLGLAPALGRDLRDEDATPGAAPVALIGYGVWENQFGRDPNIVGRAIQLGGKAVAVIGVLPKSFTAVSPNEGTVEALLPLDYTRTTANRGNHHLWTFGRLRDGLAVDQAARRMDEVAERLKKAQNIVHGIRVMSLQEWSAQWVRPRLVALMAAVGLVLFIACVNLANLQLVRITGRTAEISIKMAIGASRWRIGRELLLESLLVGLAGGALGAALAHLTLDLAENFLKSQFATFGTIQVGASALLFSLGVTLLAVALSSLVPAWRATAAWERFMRAIGRSATATPQQRRLNNAFIVAQVGLTLLVLVSAGLLVRSMHRLLSEERGFTTENVYTFRVDLPRAEPYSEAAKRTQFYDQLVDRLRALPGVDAVATGDAIPTRSGSNGYFRLPGVTWTEENAPLADKIAAGPGYFRALGIPLLRGREFDATLDRAPADPNASYSRAVIVNDAFAQKYLSGDPIGQRVGYNRSSTAEAEVTWDTVVGVVANARMSSLDRAPEPAMYRSTQQGTPFAQWVVVRSRVDAAALLPVLRAELQALDANLPLTRLNTLDLFVDAALSNRKLITWTIGVAAVVALALAMLGLYSVIAYTVAQQTREIGVRLALGAEPQTIGRWVLTRGLRLVGLGIAVGIVGSVVISQLLGSLIYGVNAWDPLTYGGVVALLTAIALLACWLPSRRAARIDPLVALRAE